MSNCSGGKPAICKSMCTRGQARVLGAGKGCLWACGYQCKPQECECRCAGGCEWKSILLRAHSSDLGIAVSQLQCSLTELAPPRTAHWALEMEFYL